MKKVILVLAILIGILVLGGGGYFAYNRFVKGESGIPAVLTGKTLNPNCKYNDPDLCKFINGWKENKYYTANDNSTDKAGKQSKAIFKIVGDDRSQMIFYEGDKEVMNTISIGDTTYTKDYSDNKWWKQTSKPADSEISNKESEFKFDDKAEETEDKTTYKKIGKEACGKYTCFKYQVIDPAATDSTQYIYFDDKQYQLRKMRTELKDGAVSETTFDYSRISISEPSPTKEGSPYGNITIPSTSTPSTNTTPQITIPTSIPTEESIPTDIPTEIPAETPTE